MTPQYKTKDEMKLLDQFAAAALPGIVAKFALTVDRLAAMAYVQAIEMVKVREMVLTTPPQDLNLMLRMRGA